MDEFCKELEKVIKAGIGAVATGVEKAGEAVEYLAEKGEPLYEQAKEKVTSAADKVVKAFNEFGKPKIESLLHDARSFTIEELKELQEKLGQLIEDMEQAQQEADVILSAEEEPSVHPENEE
ncbi:MAG: hypothetical protein IKM64_04445 [Clostridia bacterium]|nr:hypothetical protein [Clostridia bacterium]